MVTWRLPEAAMTVDCPLDAAVVVSSPVVQTVKDCPLTVPCREYVNELTVLPAVEQEKALRAIVRPVDTPSGA